MDMKAWRQLLKHRVLRWLLKAVAPVILLVFAAWYFCPKPPLYPDSLAFSQSLEDRQGQLVHLALTEDGKYRLRTALADISPALIDATLTLEDQHYRSHPGVNPMSMARALWGVVTRSRRGGGSTITMQYARLRFGLRTTSLLGKVNQMLRALQLSRHYSKDEVLEAYFNLAPYGGNVEGVGAASLLWCGKPAKGLSLREATALAVLPQSPTMRRPNVRHENKAHTAAASRLWQRLSMRSDPLDAGYALLPESRVPREVPHLARRLFAEQPHAQTIRTTIDLNKQRTLEQTLEDYIDKRREVGITNACALLVHAPSREVLAYVGSAGFLNPGILGQVDGVKARRSPGSALKPFVYALAMQQGLIHPQSLVRDGRLSFADYDPENFDREFTGPIPAAEALFRSRNIPAVALTQKLEPPGLYGFLRQASVALPKPESHYGLALPLGGAEVSMEELASMYALLADDGVSRRLSFIPAKAAAVENPVLLTPEVRYLTRGMLRAPSGSEVVADPEITWKTGTSHGFRDAWAAGMRGDYVLIVWIGNFNGRANPAFVARECAAPLLFEAFGRLRLSRPHSVPPLGVSQVELCAISGQLPTPSCQQRLTGWFIPGVSPVLPCEIHREILIDPNTGLRVTSDDSKRALKREVWEFWPPDMLAMFKQAGLPRREPPAFESGSQVMATRQTLAAPRIVSPQIKRTYTLQASDPERQSIPLRADAAAGVRKVFWFAGKQYLGASKPVESLLWKASPGTWHVQVLDDQGRSAACEVRVEMLQ
ncbi:MAG: pbpC [Verrucomicrobiaceae bacterium]|nr:pbpC [Verrucomicrobiaceae bacterium]